VDDSERYTAPPVMCLIEEEKKESSSSVQVSIGMISICPSTGDIVWDDFDGGQLLFFFPFKLFLTYDRWGYAH